MRASRIYAGNNPVAIVSGTRVCAHPGCDTLLSRYNPHPCCALHDTIKEMPPDPAGEWAVCRICGPVPVEQMSLNRNMCRSCHNDQSRAIYRGERVARWIARPGYMKCTVCRSEKKATPDNFRVDRRRPDLYKRCRACETRQNVERKAARREQERA